MQPTHVKVYVIIEIYFTSFTYILFQKNQLLQFEKKKKNGELVI